jgi:hypothetical protein
MDFYLDEENNVKRLLTEWKRYGKIIIAYDFDLTVFDFLNIGMKFDDVINLLKRCEKVGAYFLVFTCRQEKDYPIVCKYLEDINLPYNKINENVDFLKGQMTSRKLYYNIFLDDRAGLTSAYNILLKAVEHMEYERGYERHCV